MGIKLHQYTRRTIETRASLNKNKKCDIKFNIAILYSDDAVAGFSGVFWVLPNIKTVD
jgi:hypothetical protein